ncbi:MAG TPA: OmpA family protein, partial [Terriglobales bacterium]
MNKHLGLVLLFCSAAMAQSPAATPSTVAAPASAPANSVSRTTKAVNYPRKGNLKIAFQGTELMSGASGEAKVESKNGRVEIEAHLEGIDPATKFGLEYLTYVLWAVSPDGRAVNLGEVELDHGKSHVRAISGMQTFGLIVTAEPYWGVTQPSDVVVMENFIRNDTTGTIEQVDAKYELLQRGQYTKVISGKQLSPLTNDPAINLQLREARNAVAIARASGADRYANDTFQKALIDLQNAEGFWRSKGDKKQLETNAREAVQMSEDARIVS